MKKIGLVFSLVLFFSISFQLNAQWFWQNPLPQGNSLNDICLLNDSIYITIGLGGTIMKSSDSGENWRIIKTDYDIDILAIDFINNTTGWAVGDTCLILKTTDAGETWLKQDAKLILFYEDAAFKDVDFTDSLNGWVCGTYGLLLHTSDGGENWNYIGHFGRASYYHSIFFYNKNIGWLVGSWNTIMYTTNGGVDWIDYPSAYWNRTLTSIFFLDSLNGWISGGPGLVYKTTNGGLNWTQTYFNTTGEIFDDIFFITENLGFLVGTNGISASYDGGNTWMHNILPLVCGLVKVKFKDDLNGYIVGNNGTLLKTTDGGISWTYKSTGFYQLDFNVTTFVNDSTGWAIGSNKVLKTTNHGKDWIEQSLQSFINFSAMCFINEYSGWIGGTQGKVLKTSDGGDTWSTINASSENDVITGIDFVNENIGYASTYCGFVLKSTDGGLTWNSQSTSGAFYIYNNIKFKDELNGWVIGDHQSSLKTTDGGIQWIQYDLEENYEYWYTDIFYKDNIWWVLAPFHLFKSIDDGNTWTKIVFPINNNFQSVYFIDNNYGYIVGQFGVVYKTTDSGQTWSFHRSGTLNTLISTYFTNSIEGWIVGSNGTILHTTNGGVTFIEDEENNSNQPKEFLLQQNYPNPFNPSTKISWQSPVGSWQTLKVYDILGNEVATLVNEYRSAGSYEVDFQSSVGSHQLANGVYFYRLKVGDFVETKKMLLLK